MRAYRFSSEEAAMTGFTHLFCVKLADLTSFTNATTLNLVALNIGDVVYPQLLMETKTLVTGPTGTPTASVGITGAATQFTAASSVIAAPQYIVPANTVAPYVVVAASKSLIIDLEAGGGNGAAATAGEIWVWVKLSLAADRLVKG